MYTLKIIIASCVLLPLLVSGNAFCLDPAIKEVFMKLNDRFCRLHDYRCTYEAYSSDGTRSEKFVYDYFFQKPKNIRMEILTGKERGTILIYDDEEKLIHVKPGKGFLKFMSFTFAPDNQRVRDIRNHGPDHSDWGWLINKHLEDIEHFDGSKSTEEFIDCRPTIVFEFISKDPERTDYVAREKLWIDKEDYIIIKYSMYDIYGKLIQSSSFKDIELDTGFEEEMFTKFKR